MMPLFMKRLISISTDNIENKESFKLENGRYTGILSTWPTKILILLMLR